MQILSWNIQWGRGVDGVVDLDRILAVARQTADFDVLCLQEVAVNFPSLPGNDGADQPACLLAGLPGFQGFFGIGSDLPAFEGPEPCRGHSLTPSPSPGGGGERCESLGDSRNPGRSLFGNLILTRLPVLQVFRHLLPWPADFSVPSMQRVAIEAVVDAPWGPLRVVTTHLEYYSEVCRLAQVEGLRALHAGACAHARGRRPDKGSDQPFATLPRPASAVFCGDFNFPPEAPEHGLMTAPYGEGVPPLLDAWEAAHPGVAHAHSVGVNGADWPDHPYCCDFFFLTPDLASRIRRLEVNQATAASDHQPVLLELG